MAVIYVCDGCGHRYEKILPRKYDEEEPTTERTTAGSMLNMGEIQTHPSGWWIQATPGMHMAKADASDLLCACSGECLDKIDTPLHDQWIRVP